MVPSGRNKSMAWLFYTERISAATIGNLIYKILLLEAFFLIISRTLHCHVVDQGLVFGIFHAKLVLIVTIREFCYFRIYIHLEMSRYPEAGRDSFMVFREDRWWPNYRPDWRSQTKMRSLSFKGVSDSLW